MSVRYRPSETVDFLIVGSGAAGGVMAKELSSAGFKVVVLEQGPYLREKDFDHDEFKIAYRAGLINDHRKQPNTFRRTEAEKAKPQPAVEYGQMVGGGSVHFTANYWRFHESDFKELSLWGPVAGADLADWPLTYADLEPYYTKAEYEIGVSGLGGSNPFDAPRSRPYPLPPMPAKSSGVLMERGARKLGLHPFPAPVAILSKPYRGRGACLHCGFCEAFGCEVRAKSSTLAALIPAAEKTGRCEIRAECMVSRIETGKNGRVTGAAYFDRSRREAFQKARAVVLCGNGAETPRLLLLSNGLANSSGLVGKHLMFDNYAFAMGLFEHPLNEHKGIQATRVLHDFYDCDPKRGFWGGAGIDARFDWYPIQFALLALPGDAPKWGGAYKAMLAEYFNRSMSLLGHVTCLPRQQNSISLDPEVKDAWGLPAMRVTFQPHPDDLKTMAFIRDRALEILDAAGARKTWGTPVEEITYSRHLMGTCRMGRDPKTSVVNVDHRAHDVANLFIVDGSSMVTSGRQQPTATIQALAYRAAERIGALARTGEV